MKAFIVTTLMGFLTLTIIIILTPPPVTYTCVIPDQDKANPCRVQMRSDVYEENNKMEK